MANDDRNRSNAEKEPDRENAPADRSGQPGGYPGGYGPAQGQRERIGNGNEIPTGSSRGPSREH
jgi:hypothetical protein